MAKDAKDPNSDNSDSNSINPSNPPNPLFEEIDLSAEVGEDETLKSYREALQQEWSDKQNPANGREAAKLAKETIRKEAPDYLANMRGLAMGAISESVKYQANKYLLDAVLLPGGAGAKDTLGELLEELDSASGKVKTD